MKSPKSWNSMVYVCLKTTFLHLKHYLQIYLTLLSTTCVKIHQILYVIFETISHFSRHNTRLYYFSSNVTYFWQKYPIKVQRSNLSWNWREMQYLEGINLLFQKWHKEFEKFWPEHSLRSLKNFHFNGILLSKAYIFWAKKEQWSYLSSNWRGIQNLERNWLVVSKLT